MNGGSRMGIRLSVDPTSTVALRFDDPEFLEALRTEDEDKKKTFTALLGGEEPAEYDFSPYVEDGWWIRIRKGITGHEDDVISNRSQQEDARKGVKLDVAGANETLLATWVKAVGCDDDGHADKQLIAKLSDRRQRVREAAWAEVETGVRGAFLMRVRVFIDEQHRPAERDPNKTTGKMESP